ncbi:hypothetical protein QBC43DRAFT_283066 [Cladorrhinum sp. PSN259]|nr:hypothetical protein QBC43DRAFT_283066 [Cladorrhinum sp. PSN259]
MSNLHWGISYLFKSSASQTATVTPDLQPTKICNKILFALGVLLIDLCLNTTLESTRQQEQGGKGKGKATEPTHISGTLDEVDIHVANRESDRVYLNAGHLYLGTPFTTFRDVFGVSSQGEIRPRHF